MGAHDHDRTTPCDHATTKPCQDAGVCSSGSPGMSSLRHKTWGHAVVTSSARGSTRELAGPMWRSRRGGSTSFAACRAALALGCVCDQVTDPWARVLRLRGQGSSRAAGVRGRAALPRRRAPGPGSCSGSARRGRGSRPLASANALAGLVGRCGARVPKGGGVGLGHDAQRPKEERSGSLDWEEPGRGRTLAGQHRTRWASMVQSPAILEISPGKRLAVRFCAEARSAVRQRPNLWMTCWTFPPGDGSAARRSPPWPCNRVGATRPRIVGREGDASWLHGNTGSPGPERAVLWSPARRGSRRIAGIPEGRPAPAHGPPPCQSRPVDARRTRVALAFGGSLGAIMAKAGSDARRATALNPHRRRGAGDPH